MLVEILPIKKSELLELMLIDAAMEGWNYSEMDVDFYFSMSHIFSIKMNEELAGCLLIHELKTLHREPNIFSIGLFLVRKKYRGKYSLGTQLWNYVTLPKLHEKSILCLNSVPKLLNFYKKEGLFIKSVINQHLFIKKVDYNQTILICSNILIFDGNKEIPENRMNSIESFNNLLFNTSAPCVNAFLNVWTRRPDATVVVFYENETVQGYGVSTISKNNGRAYRRISPIYALTAMVAIKILDALLDIAFNSDCELVEMNMVKNSNKIFFEHIRELGFQVTDSSETVVMCTFEDSLNNLLSLEYVFSLLPLEYPHESIMFSIN